jgi:hypothetical protein
MESPELQGDSIVNPRELLCEGLYMILSSIQWAVLKEVETRCLCITVKVRKGLRYICGLFFLGRNSERRISPS